MKDSTITLLGLTALLSTSSSAQSPAYPPLREYLMSQGAEVALARSAAPANLTEQATIKVLTPTGYRIVTNGKDGFTCLVLRGWAAPTYTPREFRNLVYDPTVRAPICFDSIATRTVLPYYEMRSRLGMEGKNVGEIALAIQGAYAAGQLPKREGVSFAYMWSADQILGPPPIGHWHPHVMVFAPYYDNTTLGGNAFGSPLPQLTDDAGTPFAVVVIPVDHALAVKARSANP